MRDIVLTALLVGAIPFILSRPALGVFLWVWVSVMSPHRLTWGFAQDLRFAYLIAIATLIGIFLSKEPRKLPLTPVTVVLMVFTIWTGVTTFFAIDLSLSIEMWKQVTKSMLMTFVALYLLHSKQHVQVLIWIVTASVAFYGVKGGLFSLREGGEFRVYGPAGSFIEENNALALATIMTIPLLVYAYLQAKHRWLRWALLASMVLCGVSVLGSHSRGGFVAIIVMLAFLWFKSHAKALTGLVLIALIPVGIGFMPDKWVDRMNTIETYEEDESAMGRINAWETAYNVAVDRPLGGGFEMASRNVFNRYAPDPSVVRAAHSIYFQVLGEHGFLGLALFLMFWLFVWRDASWILRHSRNRQDLRWAFDLARMVQVSFVGYFVGGAFLSLAYYDVPYYLVVALVLTRKLVEKAIVAVEGAGATLPLAPDDRKTKLEPRIG
jgi:probable O-glycosylation ligase (exosortase A-associated)